uniref:NADH-ubiquinone oxidoreductase chain 3 n=1 Tax=Scolytinae sp. BMNH 1274712 TaxID=1796543 RepID=A0A140EG39_9CUCU|nr:NADH dehydrogenase subunit 3 [Scolytinae sp. BMNH 1274712]
MLMMSMIMLIVSILMILTSLLSMKMNMDREKSSPFECGFDPMNSARIPFSLHFFLIAVIFLIFDVEITLLIPIVQTMSMSKMKIHSMTTMFLLLILLMGLYHEWHQGSLKWAI